MELDICLEKRTLPNGNYFCKMTRFLAVELARDPTWWPWPLELAIDEQEKESRVAAMLDEQEKERSVD
jgi:hypothetical protein